MTNFILHVPFLRHDPAALRDAWTLWWGASIGAGLLIARVLLKLRGVRP